MKDFRDRIKRMEEHCHFFTPIETKSFIISIQASGKTHMCFPKETHESPWAYSAFEVALSYNNERRLFMFRKSAKFRNFKYYEYLSGSCPSTDAVFGYLDTDIVNELVKFLEEEYE